jgi:hypothetical protein
MKEEWIWAALLLGALSLFGLLGADIFSARKCRQEAFKECKGEAAECANAARAVCGGGAL